jgi:DNA-binding PadR family transcriptional regulator
MTQELVLLGLLEEGPKHGYQIKKLINRVIGTFTHIADKSIYYPLRKLEEQGLVLKRLSRVSKRPEKYTYSITKKGRERFKELLRKNLLNVQRPFLNIDLSLYFLPSLKPKAALLRLRSRLSGLKRVKIWLESMKKSLEKKKSPYHLISIAQHNLELAKAEIKFTSRLIKTLTKKAKA